MSSRSHRSDLRHAAQLREDERIRPESFADDAQALQAMRDKRCEPAHRSEVVQAAAMKSCTGPKLMESKAASPCGSVAKAVAKALERSRCDQML